MNDHIRHLDKQLHHHFQVMHLMFWDEDARARGPFWVLMTNVFDALALEQRWRAGLRAGGMHADARAINLIKRLTRVLDQVTDPFDSTDQTRAAARVEFGL